jgi:long-subunit fatty acid transport protein
MKTTTLLSLCFFVQLSFSQKISIGPELGMNFIKTEKNQLETNFQPAWYSGISANYQINDWLTIKGGLNYNQKIKTYSISDTTISPTFALIGLDSINGIDLSTYSTTSGRHSLNFIQLPIMASFTLKDFSFNLGGYISYMFSSRTKESYEEKTPFMSTFDISSIDPTGVFIGNLLPPAQKSEFTETSNMNYINQLDFGIKTGLTYTINELNFNISYLYGFKNYSNSYPSSVNLNHHYFQMSINYLFDLGKQINYSRS